MKSMPRNESQTERCGEREKESEGEERVMKGGDRVQEFIMRGLSSVTLNNAVKTHLIVIRSFSKLSALCA